MWMSASTPESEKLCHGKTFTEPIAGVGNSFGFMVVIDRNRIISRKWNRTETGTGIETKNSTKMAAIFFPLIILALSGFFGVYALQMWKATTPE